MISSVVVIVHIKHIGNLELEYCKREVVRDARAREAIAQVSMNLELQDSENGLRIIGAGEFTDVSDTDNTTVAHFKKHVVINTWRTLERPNDLVIIDIQNRQDLVPRESERNAPRRI